MNSSWCALVVGPLVSAAGLLVAIGAQAHHSCLSYTLTVTDPETFTEPARTTRAWVARDGERLLPYDCKAPRY